MLPLLPLEVLASGAMCCKNMLLAAHLAPEAEFPYTLGLVVIPDHDLQNIHNT